MCMSCKIFKQKDNFDLIIHSWTTVLNVVHWSKTLWPTYGVLQGVLYQPSVIKWSGLAWPIRSNEFSCKDIVVRTCCFLKYGCIYTITKMWVIWEVYINWIYSNSYIWYNIVVTEIGPMAANTSSCWSSNGIRTRCKRKKDYIRGKSTVHIVDVYKRGSVLYTDQMDTCNVGRQCQITKK